MPVARSRQRFTRFSNLGHKSATVACQRRRDAWPARSGWPAGRANVDRASSSNAKGASLCTPRSLQAYGCAGAGRGALWRPVHGCRRLGGDRSPGAGSTLVAPIEAEWADGVRGQDRQHGHLPVRRLGHRDQGHLAAARRLRRVRRTADVEPGAGVQRLRHDPVGAVRDRRRLPHRRASARSG